MGKHACRHPEKQFLKIAVSLHSYLYPMLVHCMGSGIIYIVYSLVLYIYTILYSYLYIVWRAKMLREDETLQKGPNVHL